MWGHANDTPHMPGPVQGCVNLSPAYRDIAAPCHMPGPCRAFVPEMPSPLCKLPVGALSAAFPSTPLKCRHTSSLRDMQVATCRFMTPSWNPYTGLTPQPNPRIRCSRTLLINATSSSLQGLQNKIKPIYEPHTICRAQCPFAHHACGWFSKFGSPLRSPRVRNQKKSPKRDPSLENYPCASQPSEQQSAKV